MFVSSLGTVQMKIFRLFFKVNNYRNKGSNFEFAFLEVGINIVVSCLMTTCRAKCLLNKYDFHMHSHVLIAVSVLIRVVQIP